VGVACVTVALAVGAFMAPLGCTPSRSGSADQREAAAPDDTREVASPLSASPLPARTEPGDRVVLVELFSSEGCSSCPPADRVLADLAASPPAGTVVVALEHHVDYWDDLGWQDRFASRDATMRQREYGPVRGTSGVFTPEAIVDGKHSLVGSRRAALVEIIEERARLAHLPVRVTLNDAQTRATVHIGQQPPKPSALYVGVVESGLTTKVLAGENRGETLAHAPVVRRLTEVGPAREGDVEVELDSPVSGARSVVAFVQALPLGEVYGTAMTSR
jgi:hypothetical protein